MLDKGRLYPRLPNTRAGIKLSRGQLYSSIFYVLDEAVVPQGGSESTVITSAEASGTKIAFGGSEAGITVSTEGIGTKLAELHLHLICNNSSAGKQVKFELEYLTSAEVGTILGGAGNIKTVTVDVPETENEVFQVRFHLLKSDFSNKPYLTARITRIAVDGNPDPDDDPIVYKACLVYS